MALSELVRQGEAKTKGMSERPDIRADAAPVAACGTKLLARRAPGLL
jgi:hypothetical protein